MTISSTPTTTDTDPRPTGDTDTPSTPDTVDTDTPSTPDTVDTDHGAVVARGIVSIHRANPDHGARVAALTTPDVLSVVAAFRDDDMVAAAYRVAMAPDAWIDPVGTERRRIAILTAGIVDVLSTVPTAMRDALLSDVLGTPGTIDGAGWVGADDGAVGRVVVATDDPTPRRASTGGPRTRSDRDPARVVGRSFQYRGHTVTVGRDGSWSVDTGDTFTNPTRAARSVNGDVSVNGWRDAWIDTDGNTPDDYATA